MCVETKQKAIGQYTSLVKNTGLCCPTRKKQAIALLKKDFDGKRTNGTQKMM